MGQSENEHGQREQVGHDLGGDDGYGRHEEDEDGPVRKRMFTCEVCPKGFRDNRDLRRHIKSMHSYGPYQCPRYW